MGFRKLLRRLFCRGRRRLHRRSKLPSPSLKSVTPPIIRLDKPAPTDPIPHANAPVTTLLQGVHSRPSSESITSLASNNKSLISPYSSSHPRPMLHTVGNTVFRSAEVLKEVLDGVHNMGVLKGTMDGLLKIIKIIQQKHEMDTAIKELDNLISELVSRVLEPLMGRQAIEIPSELKTALTNFAEDIEATIDEKNLLKPASSLHAYLDAEESMQVITQVKSTIQLLLQQSIFRAQITATLSNYDERIKQHVRNIHVIPAAYDSESSGTTPSRRRACFGTTAARALKAIDNWIDSDSDPNVLVVYGLAGMGKSTIAQTIAESRVRSVDNRRRLGASFFVARDQTYNHKAFFPTIAYQLAKFDSSYVPHLGSYLDSVLRVEDCSLQEQLTKMIVEPLSEIPNAPVNRALIILDALDEFDQRQASLLLDQLLESIPGTQLKVLITCRLEPHIKEVLGFIDDEHPKDVLSYKSENMLHLINPEDIRSFIHFELSEQTIKTEFPRAKWSASLADLDALVIAAGSLFIVAATMVGFIKDRKHKNPERRCHLVLDSINKANQSKEFPYATLDKLYITILRSSLPNPLGEDFMERYQTVIGAIIFLQQPLSSEALGAFIDLEPDQVDAAIHDLTSVIHRKDRCPQVYHTSFADFLTDRKRCANAEETGDPAFYIDADKHHARLAELGLDVMLAALTKSNILNLSDDDWFKDRKDQNITEERISEKISPQLQYACRYWASHFSQSSNRGDDMTKKLEGFATNCLLFWIEALAWTGDLGDGVSALILGQPWDVPDLVRSLFYDGQRLLMQYYEIIKNSPLHLYSSALTSIPSQTALFKTYKEKAKKGIEILSGQPMEWNTVLAVLHGHSKAVASVTFSPDGDLLASTSDDGTIQLWDGITGKDIVTLHDRRSLVTCIAFSPDSKQLASASNDYTIRLWNDMAGKEMATLNGHTHRVTSVAFSPDGNRLASGSYDTTVRLWDSATGKEIAALNGHTGWVTSVVFSPDGNRLVSASNDHTLRLWNGVTGEDISTLIGHTALIRSVAFSPDGTRLASASDDYIVRLWDGVTGEGVATLNGHWRAVTSIVFSPDGKRLASASDDETVLLWDGVTGKRIFVLNGHANPVTSVTFSPDSKRLATASNGHTVQLWDGVTGRVMSALDGHTDSIRSIAFSLDGCLLASASDDHTIRLWAGATGREIAVLNGHTNSVRSVVFSPDGNRLASASNDKTVRIWDISGNKVATSDGSWGLVTSVAFSLDGKRLASASSDYTVRIWDGVTGNKIAALNGHTDAVTSIAFSPNGSRLASASNDYTIRLWDAVAGTEIATLNGHWRSVISVAFSSDSKRLASASEDRSVRLWDGVTGKEIVALSGHSRSATPVVFSCESNQLASASSDHTIRLRDGVTGNKIAALNGHTDTVTSIAFSPDGRRLASASHDKTVRLWDAVAGTEIAALNSRT